MKHDDKCTFAGWVGVEKGLQRIDVVTISSIRILNSTRIPNVKSKSESVFSKL